MSKRYATTVLMCCIAFSAVSCDRREHVVAQTAPETLTDANEMDITTAVLEAEKWMDEYAGVIGVSQGARNGKPVISVFINNDEVADKLPTEFKGYPVVIEFSDEFRSY